MALVYSLVARGSSILAEYTDRTGTFTVVTQSILDRIPNKDAKCTYVYDRFLFHYVREGDIIYLCMADEAFGRRVPFAFLAQIKKDFVPFRSRADKAIPYALNRDFAPILNRQMAAFSRNAGGDSLATAQNSLDEVKGIMVQNIEKVLAREEILTNLIDKSENLSAESQRFKKKSQKLKNQMCWENQKMCLILTLVLAIIATIIGVIIYEKTK